MRRHRTSILLISLAVLLTVAVTAVVLAVKGRPTQRAGTVGHFALSSGYLTFRATTQGPDFGTVAEVPLSNPQSSPSLAQVSCERSYTAANTLLCLRSEGTLTTTPYALVYTSSAGVLQQVKKTQIVGMPNRARLSADGRMAAWTTFVSGDSYIGPAFSTRTSILDLKTGAYTASLESFNATVDGQSFHPVDVNYWGVTFAADDNTFYATMGSGGKTWLMRGDIAARTLVSVHDNVECPSLSPDGARIAFKKRIPGDVRKPWRLEVLDLHTMAETPLAEPKSVDDQAAWLDNRTVAYGLPHADDAGYDVWQVPADGSGASRLLVPNASSPAVTS